MRVLLLTPPMTQLNTPYPATAYLTGFLRKHGVAAVQDDPAIKLVLRLLSSEGLTRIVAELETRFGSVTPRRRPPAVRNFMEQAPAYLGTVDRAIRFLQGRDPSIAIRIAARTFLPEGPRFQALAQLETVDENYLDWAFGALGTQDRAKYLASLYVDDLADVIRDGIDERFELSRYGDRLAASAPTFDPLADALASPPSLVDDALRAITLELIEQHKPEVVGLTAPFPGNVYAAFRMAQVIRERAPETKLILGGGFVNTELRSLTEPRVFDYFDFITLDDGERPLLCLLEHIAGKRSSDDLLRTYVREQGKVVLKSTPSVHDIPLRDAGTPTYDGLPLDSYLSLCEMVNPMHRVWSDGRWNKLTLAHGCYWKRCNFCDTSLDYINRYDEVHADILVDRILAIVEETGQSGFHFVDEAAPPKALFALSRRLLERNVAITWWGNVRFEKTFTPDMAKLMARAGCIAVSGGLEVASDRLLKLMNKGVTVEQVARVTRAFTDANILVHAYLMYGFPTQTVQETIDALERVRQLFEAGCIQSAYWHRFAATAHSPIGQDPDSFGIKILPLPPISFAHNDLDFIDPTGVDHETLGAGLRKALYNYMHGVELDADVRAWFDVSVPRPKVPRDLVQRALSHRNQNERRRKS